MFADLSVSLFLSLSFYGCVFMCEFLCVRICLPDSAGGCPSSSYSNWGSGVHERARFRSRINSAFVRWSRRFVLLVYSPHGENICVLTAGTHVINNE